MFLSWDSPNSHLFKRLYTEESLNINGKKTGHTFTGFSLTTENKRALPNANAHKVILDARQLNFCTAERTLSPPTVIIRSSEVIK
jgi:hypothetical protein